MASIAIALLLLLGREQIAHNELTLGAFVAFVAAVLSMYNPVRKFAVFNNSFQQALGASSQLFKFMDTEDVVREKPRAKALPRFSQSIRFESVVLLLSVATATTPREILHDIDLEVKRGEILAIVGSSGAGKSTLVHLIPRFFDVTGGRILIDGHDVRDVTLSSLRAQVGIVTQETVLFNDTVRNNIAYGQPHVPHERSRGRGPRRAGARLHSGPPGGLRYCHRRARRAAFRRRAPASGDCARAAEECADPDSGRGHFGARQRVGSRWCNPRCTI